MFNFICTLCNRTFICVLVFIKLISKNNIDLISQFDKMDINNVLGDIIMKKLFFATTISSALILGACGNSFIENDKEDDKTDNKQTAKKNKDEQQKNTSNQESKNQISESEALKRAENVFSSGSYHDFKIDQNRTNNSEYFITFLLNDAVGTPQKSATTVNKQSGEVGDYLDDRTEEDIENYIQFIRESPKYKGSSEKLEEQARKDHTRPNDNERESNEQKPKKEPNEQSNEEAQQPRNEGGTAKIAPPETKEEESDERQSNDENDANEPKFKEQKQEQQTQQVPKAQKQQNEQEEKDKETKEMREEQEYEGHG